MTPLTTSRGYSADPARLMRVAEVADLLGVSPRTVRRAVRSGDLDPVRIGRAVRFEPGDVAKLIAFYKKNDRQGDHPDDRENPTTDAGSRRVSS